MSMRVRFLLVAAVTAVLGVVALVALDKALSKAPAPYLVTCVIVKSGQATLNEELYPAAHMVCQEGFR